MGAEDVLAKAKRRKTEAVLEGARGRVIDDGPDMSGLNVEPEEPGLLARAGRALVDPTTATGAGAQKFAQGASYGFSDELQGAMGAMDEGSHIMRQAVGLEDKPEPSAAALDAAEINGGSPDPSIYERLLAAYRSNRDAQRGNLDRASEAQPVVSTVAELGGAMMAPGPKVKGLPPGATRLQRMASMGKAAAPVGAAFGAGNSTADITEGDVGGLLKDTAIGTGISGASGAVLGGLAHGPLSRLEGKERLAIEKSEEMGRKALETPVLSDRGALGAKVREGNTRLKTAMEMQGSSVVDDATQQANKAFLESPEGVALANRVARANAEELPGLLAQVDAKQAAYDASRKAFTPEAVAREAERIRGPERFKEASMMRLKKYAGRVAPPFIGSAVGGALGGAEGAMGGALAGSIASAVLGSPGTALANYMRDPSVMLRLAQLGQSPAATQAPVKAAAMSLTKEEERRRYLERLLEMGR